MKTRISAQILAGIMVLGWNLPLFAQTVAPPATNDLASLQARLTEFVSQPRLASAALGIKVVSLQSGRTLFEQNSRKLLKPASNAKLYSGALALDRLGPDFRIKTSVYAAAKPDATGVVNGDLIVYGRGDPSFAARFNNGDHKKSLLPLVDAIITNGVKQVTGDLVGDESYFRGAPMGSGWTWDDLQYYYGAEVSALTVEDNVVDLVIKPGAKVGEPCRIVASTGGTYLEFRNRTTTVEKDGRGIDLYRPVGENVVYVRGSLVLGSTGATEAVAVHQPAKWFVTLLKEALEERGVRVGGKVRSVNWLDRQVTPLDLQTMVEITSAESRPMSEMLAKMLKPSQNLYAQLLLLQVGAQAEGYATSTRSTESLGVAELNKFLGEIGIKRGDVLLEEGSGLSRSALLTPDATISLLQFMNQHRHAAVYRDGLPVAGIDGTLRSRFGGTPVAGNARAKTGTLRYVNAISGYLHTAAKEPLVFSIMLNNYNPTDAKYSGRAEVDALVLLLATLSVPTPAQ